MLALFKKAFNSEALTAEDIEEKLREKGIYIQICPSQDYGKESLIFYYIIQKYDLYILKRIIRSECIFTDWNTCRGIAIYKALEDYINYDL